MGTVVEDRFCIILYTVIKETRIDIESIKHWDTTSNIKNIFDV